MGISLIPTGCTMGISLIPTGCIQGVPYPPTGVYRVCHTHLRVYNGPFSHTTGCITGHSPIQQGVYWAYPTYPQGVYWAYPTYPQGVYTAILPSAGCIYGHSPINRVYTGLSSLPTGCILGPPPTHRGLFPLMDPGGYSRSWIQGVILPVSAPFSHRFCLKPPCF